jgi:hypothetical protein
MLESTEGGRRDICHSGDHYSPLRIDFQKQKEIIQMIECPHCHNSFDTPGKIRSRNKQKSRSIEYVTRMIDLLSLDVEFEEIKDAVDTLYEEGYFAKKRAS